LFLVPLFCCSRLPATGYRLPLRLSASFQHVAEVLADPLHLLFLEAQDFSRGLADGRDVLLDVTALLEFLLVADDAADVLA